jgi:hypothetical protein
MITKKIDNTKEHKCDPKFHTTTMTLEMVLNDSE